MTTIFPVSTLPVDDGLRAFLSTKFKELAVLFETWETRSNWFYPWARFSDFSRHIQLAKKKKKEKSVRVVFKPGHFHGVRSYHISKASDRWLRGGGGDKCHYHLLAHQSVRLPVFSHMGTLTTMPSHFFTYKSNRLPRVPSVTFLLVLEV